MNILELLKIAAPAPAAPSQPAAPLPNPVNAPSIQSPAAAGGPSQARYSHVPRVAASKPTGDSANYSSTPLQPSAPGQMIPQQGMLLSPEEAQMQAQAQAEQQAAAGEDKPAEPKQPDTVLTKQLLSSWDSRLGKVSTDVGFLPVKQFPGGGSSHFDYTQPGGVVGGYSPGKWYNPFPANTGLDWLYDFGKKFIASKLNATQPKSLVERNLETVRNPYATALAMNMADPVQSGVSPLAALGANLSSVMQGGQLDPNSLAGAYDYMQKPHL